ncbi:hypothetical protein QCA50_003326 [Cerrena zonata]|uniref:Ribosomal protein mS38 C-terminal domain-containing protein n=1 Tax=Cerrena zonata TaxID=2478898 RepID=A0AAW0GRS2_9APHY
MFSRFVRPPQVATRRAYSVFSKPGGGRYFNSAKPPKVATAVTQKPSATNPSGKVDAGASNSNDSADDVNAASSSQGIESQQTPSNAFSSLSFPVVNTPPLSHPPVNPQDFRLHQFFSQHRPLLTLTQPTTSIFETPSISLSNFPPQATKSSEASEKHLNGHASGMMGTIDNPPEASAESDADAARQLARALVVNRVGADLAWEATLKKLGLDVSEGRVEEVKLAEEQYQVYLDSTKRKRRKKMKTHKLKKRRRLTRMKRANERS